MESMSFTLVTTLVCLAIALCFLIAGLRVFRNFKTLGKILNRAHEMTGESVGSISQLVTVRRRNRTFRWVNEYPVISYDVNGKTYTVEVPYAEKRKGRYTLGGSYTVNYVPSDPTCCVVEEFRKSMQRSRTGSLVGAVILFFFTFNLVVSSLSMLFFG